VSSDTGPASGPRTRLSARLHPGHIRRRRLVNRAPAVSTANPSRGGGSPK
jgi:hypothetical protein